MAGRDQVTDEVPSEGPAGGSKALAALLAHEWLHTTQTKIDEKAAAEKKKKG